MAIQTLFVGIDRYQDPDVKELSGAARDALALSSLFEDTLPDIEAICMTDGAATLVQVRSELRRVLGESSTGDTVVVSFSGHGTPDHRLVLNDSRVDALGSTALPMSELADLFRESKARAILCVLDCCFSGGAPAKVLEGAPAARAVGSYEDIVGEGRVLIAASRINEPAYEDPKQRHGLLTHTLLRLLQEGDQVEHDILQLSSALLRDVRAESARLGFTQTPVVLGNVTGGLAIPRLIAGEKYADNFPERRGIRVSANIADLAEFGLDALVLDEWHRNFSEGLNPLQLLAVNDHRLLEGRSLVVVAPTSSGKTFIGELAGVQALHDGRKAVFLFPYKAIVNEKFDAFSRTYGDALNLRVIRCTGDYADQAGPFVKGKFDIALLTYEMFFGLVATNPDILHRIGLVVVDEAQFITDSRRGIVVELVLTSLISARERGIEPQIITLSAVVRQAGEFAHWLGAGLLETTERPIPLREGVLDREGQYLFISEDGELQSDQMLEAHRIQTAGNKQSSRDILIPLVDRLIRDGEKVLIFRNSRGAAQGCANYLANNLGLEPASDALDLLPEGDLSDASQRLRAALDGGVAFHNTNLTAGERVVVERSFRDPTGGVRVLASTTTMAAGINTPADTVIICETFFAGPEGEAYTVADYKNMAGRAGRLGFRQAGKSILLAENRLQAGRLVARYVQAEIEPIRSSFDPAKLDTWVLRLLVQVEEIDRTLVSSLLANTFGGYQANRADSSWRYRVGAEIEKLLERMVELGLLRHDSGKVSLTILGRACGGSSLSFSSSLRLVEVLRGMSPDTVTGERLLGVVQCLPEAIATYVPLFRKNLSREQQHLRRSAQRFGDDILGFYSSFSRTAEEYYGMAKRGSLAAEWIDGVAVEDIERTFSVNPFQAVRYGDIRSVADNSRWLLRAVGEIAALIHPGVEMDVQMVQDRLEFGLPSAAVGLLQLPVHLDRAEFLALHEAGLSGPDEVLELPEERLREILGDSRATSLIEARDRQSS